MSGPKVDVAEIRKQEMERLAAARQKRYDATDKVSACIRKIEAGLGNGAAASEHLKTVQEEALKELKKLQRTLKMGNELLDVEAILNKANTIMKEYMESVSAQLGLEKELATSTEAFKTLEKNRYTIANLRRKEWTLSEEDEEIVISEADVKEQQELFIAEIHRVMNSDEIPKKGRKTLLILHQDMQELVASGLSAERKCKRINRMMDEFEKTVNLLKGELESMRGVYEEYCREMFDSEEKPRAISEFESVEEIRDAIVAEKDKALGRMSKEYIRRQIDEVMQKHGYDVVRSDMLAEANESGQILYGVDDETAINVFVSEESQVTMRVVGIGFDSQISGEEDEKLFQQQCAFCSLHPQITAELEMRGVILHTKKHMPPDKKFNKKIQTKEKSGTQGMSRAKKELKRTELKVMRKE
ncbi:MAG: hypothetical protein IJ379_11975 [Lachnospiraceae bacterium]|nr:hypothetical protein [Lachnospiraceae bacterium]